MILNILLVLAVLAIVAVVVIALQPAAYRYSRSATIAAAPGTVFPHVNDLSRQVDWQPWVKAECDPAIRRSYEGPASGVGATYVWSGNNAAGAGRMVITESRANEFVRVREDYEKPFAATCLMEFALAREDGRTRVTWTMTGRKNFPMKAIHLFMGRVIVGEFEKGLAALKAVAEAPPKS